jgi:hypothetical protein
MRRFHAAHRAILAITLFVLVLGTACSKGSGSGGGASTPAAGGAVTANPVTKTQVIGIEGGEIVADDGSWKLTIPAFALRIPQEIKITSDATPVGTVGSEYLKVSKAFKFEPHGLFFEQPASFWFKYEQGDMPEGGLQEKMVGLSYVHDDSGIENTQSTVNLALNEATSKMQHFSFGFVMTIQILLVNNGIISNVNPVQNIANAVIAHFAGLTTNPTPLEEYQAYQAMLNAFITKTEQILGYNPLFQAFPSIFPPGTTGGYNVVYNANGAESGTAPSDSTIYPTGNNATVLGNTGSMTRAYHTFAGWNTAADGSGTLYVVGASLAIASANVMLHAQWVEDPKYTITYHANTSTGGTVPIDIGQYYAGMSVIVAANTGGLYKASNIFLGWNSHANGSGTAYAPVSTITMPAANVDLYATWASQFTRLFGTAGAQTRGGWHVRDSQGYIYLVANTNGSFADQTQVGSEDILLIKFDAAGNLVWARHIGHPGSVHNYSNVALDSDENPWITGFTTVNLHGETKAGIYDAFVIKFSKQGVRQWTRLHGVATKITLASQLASLGNGGMRFVGHTNGDLGGVSLIGQYDAFVSDISSDGILGTTRHFGVGGANTNAYGISIDSAGGTCVTGATSGNLHGQTKTGNSDTYTFRLDAAGNLSWTTLTGYVDSSMVTMNIVATNAGECYTAGYVNTQRDGAQVVNWYDFILIKHNINGQQWTRLTGVAGKGTNSTALVIDPFDQLYVCGNTDGNLGGQIVSGTSDVALMKFDNNGTLKYVRLLGVTAALTAPFACTSDKNGNIATAGFTRGNLDGQLLTGTEDIFFSNNIMDTGTSIANALTYSGNGNTSGVVPVDANAYVHGATVTAKPRAANFRRDNFAFAGWNTQSDGSGSTRLPGKQFSMGPSAETLHAKWRNKWTRLHGESGRSTTVEATATSADGYVYSVGYAPAGFLGELPSDRSGFVLHKRDLNGAVIWRRVGYSDGNTTLALSVQVDSQNRVLVAGQTNGSISSSSQIGRTDGFIAIYSAAGVFTQVIRVGAPNANVYIRKIKVDAQDNIYAIGQTSASLDGQNLVGAEDTFIKKFSKTGVLVWSQHIGAPGAFVRGADIDIFGSTFYVVGSTNAALSTDAFAGYLAGFISRRSVFNGMPVWTRTFGMPHATTSFTGVARSGCMQAYVIGETYASLYTPRLVKYTGWHKLAFVGNYTDLGQTFFANNQEQGISIGSIIESDYGTSAIGVACQNNIPTGLFSFHGNYWVQGYHGAIAGLGSSTAILFSPTQGITNNRLLAYGTAGTAVRPTSLVADFLGVWHIAGYTYGPLDGEALTGTQDAFLTNRLGW